MKVRKSIIVSLMLVVLLLGIVGCGEKEKGPAGRYGDGQVATMIFDDNNVTLKFGQLTSTGVWKIKDGKVTVNFDKYSDQPKTYTYDAEKDTITGASGNVLYFQGN